MNEEKEFLSKEIKNSKHYNNYLKNKIKELENNPKIETSFNNTSNIMKTLSPKNKEKEQENIEKLEKYFKRNEEILINKMVNEEKTVKEKYHSLKNLESFNNPILQVLSNRFQDYEFTLMNSKVSNQEVFFNNSENDGKLSTRRVL